MLMSIIIDAYGIMIIYADNGNGEMSVRVALFCFIYIKYQDRTNKSYEF